MKRLYSLFAGMALCVSPLVSAAVPKIIFDTDMVEDYDDVGAMAVLHALADEGKCEILAISTCTRDNSSVAAVEVLNAFYGRPEIPVGCAKELGVVGTPRGDAERKGHQKFVRLAATYPEWVKHPNSNDAPDANKVYRKALAAAPDKSVTFVSVGFITNMRRLLETKGDEFSPLDGRSLVAKKVVRWYAMACKHPKGREYNSKWDAASSKIAFENWPTPIVFSDFDLGRNIYSGRTVAEQEYAYRNPVKDIFSWSLPSREKVRAGKAEEKSEEGRCSWDEVTVFAAVNAIGRYFNTERGMFRMVGDQGEDEWIPDEKSASCRLLPAEGRERYNYPGWAIGRLIDELIAREPKCRRTDEAIASFRRSKLETTPTGVRLLRDGQLLWNFEIDTPEGRPFFHPLNLPSGKPLTDVRPKDHVWHLGWWFSWKFINGVNYWEPADAKRAGVEPEGRTRVTKKSISRDGLDCVVKLNLDYGPRAAKEPVLTEERTIEIDPPDPNGGYTINIRHLFTARQDVTLDRTPPHGSTAKGKWGGGYAGATLRLAPSAAAAFGVRGFAGGDTPAAVTGTETKFLDLADPATGEARQADDQPLARLHGPHLAQAGRDARACLPPRGPRRPPRERRPRHAAAGEDGSWPRGVRHAARHVRLVAAPRERSRRRRIRSLAARRRPRRKGQCRADRPDERFLPARLYRPRGRILGGRQDLHARAWRGDRRRHVRTHPARRHERDRLGGGRGRPRRRRRVRLCRQDPFRRHRSVGSRLEAREGHAQVGGLFVHGPLPLAARPRLEHRDGYLVLAVHRGRPRRRRQGRGDRQDRSARTRFPRSRRTRPARSGIPHGHRRPHRQRHLLDAVDRAYRARTRARLQPLRLARRRASSWSAAPTER